MPERTTEQTFLTLVAPLDKGAASPRLEKTAAGHTRIIHRDGTRDEVGLTTDGELTVIRHEQAGAVTMFPPGKAGLARALATNSEASARALAAGLKTVRDRSLAARDALTRQGRANLALGARVRASGTRDARFSPEKVVDNETAEYPLDGRLDYTLGNVASSGR